MIGAKLIEAAGNGISTVAVAEAIDFDGTNDYLSRASDLVGNTDSKTFTFSAWVWYDGTSLGEIFQTEAAGTKGLRVYMNGTQIVARIYNSAGTLLGQLTAGLVAEKTFCNILISCDTNATTWAIYVNDVLAQTGTPTNALIDFAGYTPEIAGPRTGYFDGRLSNVFLDYTYRNLSIEANRRLFVTADLKPAAGQAALNPILYLPMDDPTAPGVNAGTGGNFTLTGTVARSGRGPNQYNAAYSTFSGSQFLSRTSNIMSGSQPTALTFSVTFRISGGSGDRMLFIISDVSDLQARIYATRNSANQVSVFFYNAARTAYITWQNGQVLTINRDYTLTVSYDCSNGNKSAQLNGVNTSSSIFISGTPPTSFGVIQTTPRLTVGAWFRDGGQPTENYFLGNISNVYLNTSYIDLSVADNLAKFVTGTGIDAKPVDLGANGELPTGTSPLIYLPMYGNNAGKNYGTGGDFTVNSGPYTGARGPNEFWGNKADFNGTTGYLSKAATLFADGKTFSCVFWVQLDAINLTQRVFNLASGATTIFGANINSSNQLQIFGRNLASSLILSSTTTSTTFAAGTTYCIQICIDLANSSNRKIYINGVDSTTTWSSYTNDSINFSNANPFTIGAIKTPSDFVNGKLAEFYLSNQYVDFSQEANRLKFRDAFGNPVNLTQQIEDAAIPNPAIYMRFPPTAFGTNYGTGGNFTVNGTITDGGQL